MAIECVVGKRRHEDGKMVKGWLVRGLMAIERVVGKEGIGIGDGTMFKGWLVHRWMVMECVVGKGNMGMGQLSKVGWREG